MIFAHTGDLHIGKRLYEVSLIEEQKNILEQIRCILKNEKVDALIIAGDIYDKPTPSVESVKVFDDFVSALKDDGIKLYAISGNHDAMERISFGSRIMAKEGIYFHENFQGKAQKITSLDEYGEINIYMVPYVKPVYVGESNYEVAFKKVLECSDIDYNQRNVLVAHQFVVGAKAGSEETKDELIKKGLFPLTSDSETINVGGLDNISYELMKEFDYVALGHLHRRQYIGKSHIRYAGSPYKYSFSERHDVKSIELVEVKEKGIVDIRTIDLVMPRDLREIKGTLEQLVSEEIVNHPDVDRDAYVRAIITDEERVTDGAAKLKRWYPNLLTIAYERDMNQGEMGEIASIKGKTPIELFGEFYEMINKTPMSQKEECIIRDILGGDEDEA
ncbi:MAG: exonuclease SbcCD subunit D [Lachnospiraceae bacterium]|nr:exonuclease SbcCD subunit D [Lachnospiraceae bacterium]